MATTRRPRPRIRAETASGTCRTSPGVTVSRSDGCIARSSSQRKRACRWITAVAVSNSTPMSGCSLRTRSWPQMVDQHAATPRCVSSGSRCWVRPLWLPGWEWDDPVSEIGGG